MSCSGALAKHSGCVFKDPLHISCRQTEQDDHACYCPFLGVRRTALFSSSLRLRVYFCRNDGQHLDQMSEGPQLGGPQFLANWFLPSEASLQTSLALRLKKKMLVSLACLLFHENGFYPLSHPCHLDPLVGSCLHLPLIDLTSKPWNCSTPAPWPR